MGNIIKISLAVVTLLITITMVIFTAMALTIPNWILFATCLMLASGFGYFNYQDYKFFFGKKK